MGLVTERPAQIKCMLYWAYDYTIRAILRRAIMWTGYIMCILHYY